MKKTSFVIAAIVAIVMGLSACVPPEVYVISDTHFGVHVHLIRREHQSYVGRHMQLTGEFIPTYWPETGERIYAVGRFYEDCCSPGEFLGFELALNDIDPPEAYAWVEVVGIFELYYIENAGYIMRLNAQSITEVEA